MTMKLKQTVRNKFCKLCGKVTRLSLWRVAGFNRGVCVACYINMGTPKTWK